MRKIPLAKSGKYAIVDDEDYIWASRQSWYYHKSGPKHGYARGTVKRKRVYLHRLICKSSKLVDHINCNTLDNRRCNLRSVTRSQNMQNSTVLGKGTTKYKGVFRKLLKSGCIRFTASIQKDRASIWLGSYETMRHAAMAYNDAAKRIYGIHAKLNPCG